MERKTRTKTQNKTQAQICSWHRREARPLCVMVVLALEFHTQAPKALQELKILNKDKSHCSKQPLTFPLSFVDTQVLPVAWHLLLLVTFWPKNSFHFFIAAKEKKLCQTQVKPLYLSCAFTSASPSVQTLNTCSLLRDIQFSNRMLFHPLYSKSSWPKVVLVLSGFLLLLYPSFFSMFWHNSRPDHLINIPLGGFLVQTHLWKLPNFRAHSSAEISNGVYKHCLLLTGKQLDFTISQIKHSNREQSLKKEIKQLNPIKIVGLWYLAKRHNRTVSPFHREHCS